MRFNVILSSSVHGEIASRSATRSCRSIHRGGAHVVRPGHCGAAQESGANGHGEVISVHIAGDIG